MKKFGLNSFLADENKTSGSKLPRFVIGSVIGITSFCLIIYGYLFFASSAHPELVKAFTLLLSFFTLLTAALAVVLFRWFVKDANKYRVLYTEEKEIREKMENYKLLLENQNEGVSIVDADENILFANKMADEIFAVEPGKLLGRSFSEFLDAAENKKNIAQINLRKLGFSNQYEIKIKSGDGRTRSLQVTATPKFNESAQYEGSFIVFSDATELKNVESRLSESTAYLRALIESIPQMIWLKDKNLQYIMANQRFVDALEKTEEQEIFGKTDSELVNESLASTYNAMDEKVIQSKHPHTIIEESSKNGKPFWTETVKTPIFDDNGDFIGISGITSDISERVESEKSIRQARDFYLQLFEDFPVMIWMTNQIGEPIYYNQTYLKFRGLSQNANYKEGWLNSLRPEKQEEVALHFKNCFESRLAYDFEYEMTAGDDDFHWIVDIGHPYNDLDGNFAGYIGACLDITDQKASAAKILDSEERYKNLVENISDVVFRVSKTGELVYVSPVITQLTGYVPENITGKRVVDFVHPHDSNHIQQQFYKALAVFAGPEDFRIKSLISGYRWVRAQALPYIENGIPIGIQGILTDIENSKQAEQALRESEERFRSIFENAYEGILLVDENGKLVDWNHALEQMTGYKAEEVLQMSFVDIHYSVLPEELSQSMTKDVLMLKHKEYFEQNLGAYNYRARRISIRHKSGELHLADVISFPIKSGNTNLLCSIIRDVTKEMFVEQENLKLNLAIEQSPNIVIISDLNGMIQYANPAFEVLTGYAVSDVKGKKTSILKSGKTDPAVYKNLWETISKGDIWRGELCNKRKNGEFYWELASISPVRNADGVITNYLAIKEDITDRKTMENQLVAAKDNAEEMNRLKSNFLANMSHELRTPMIGILGYSTMLRDEFADEDIKNIGSTIYRSGTRLLETLNLILDLSRLEAQKVDIQLTSVNVIEILNEVLTLFDSAAKLKGLPLQPHFAHAELCIETDVKLFRHIATNLINNAIKYTRRGGIDVFCGVVNKLNVAYLELKVSDTGIGISEADQKIIFEEFRQVSEGFNRSFEGTGLGLTLTQRFVEKLNGEILVESELGKGSSFIVRLPMNGKKGSTAPQEEIAPKLEEEPPIPDMPKNEKASILLVENDMVNAEVISYFLHKNYNLEVAGSGEDALELVSGKHYDLLLMDINLGQGISGLDVTRVLRESEQYKNTPVIAITAFAMKGDREEFLESGCTDYLAKPFSKSDLLKKIQQYLD